MPPSPPKNPAPGASPKHSSYQQAKRSSGVQIAGHAEHSQIVTINIHNHASACSTPADVAKTLQHMEALLPEQRHVVLSFSEREFGTRMSKELDDHKRFRLRKYIDAVLKA